MKIDLDEAIKIGKEWVEARYAIGLKDQAYALIALIEAAQKYRDTVGTLEVGDE